MDILISDLSKTYDNGSRVIFDGLDVQFASGKVSVILGKSGTGKSSLLNLIAGIDLPDSGSIRVGTHGVSGMTDARRTLFRRRHIGFVFQSFNLVPVLSVLENVALVGRLDGRSEPDCRRRALSLLAAVELEDRKDDFPDRLSGGEQQRVALARALINDPEVILADEPTGNLDADTGVRILDTIAGQAKDLGKTLVMVTHSREAMAYADDIFRVRDFGLSAWSAP